MRRQSFVNGALLALALGTLGVVWATRETATTVEVAERKNKLLPSFRPEQLERLLFVRGTEQLELTRDGSEFRIVRPWNERADVASVRQVLGALELASALRPADGVALEQAGFSTPSALRIQLVSAGQTSELTLGGPAPSPHGARYARVQIGGDTKLYVVSPGVESELDVPFEKFRETRLLEYGRSELAKISIAGAEGKLELEQREHGAFFVAQPEGWELANRGAVEAVLTALSRLASEEFVEPEQARASLSQDGLRVELQLTDKAVPPVVLRFGRACPKAPGKALVLREQAGRPARAGCIPADVEAALHVTAEEARLLGPFSARTDEVEELKVILGSRRLELARKDKAFVLRGQVNADVPLDAGNQRISAVLQARGRKDRAPFEPAGEVTIQIAGGNEAAHRQERVLLAKPRGDGSLCLKRDLDGVVLCVDAEGARAFEPDATLLRGLDVLAFPASELVGLSIETDGLKQRLVRRDDGSYELQEPAGFAHDGALASEAVQTLGALQAVRWVAASEEPRFGLASPRLRALVTLKSATAPRELVVGGAAPGGYFARLGPEPGVFVLPGSSFSALATPLIDRSLAPFAEADLATVEVTPHGRKALPVSGPLLGALGSLRAELTVHLGPPRALEQLDTPRTVLTFTAKSGERKRLAIGACDTVQEASVCYARLEGVNATFGLSRRLVADLQDFSKDAP